MPQDYINSEDCEKIIKILSQNGRIKNIIILKLILKLINNSLAAPSSLKDLVLNEIKSTISTGQSFIRASNRSNVPHIDTTELEIIKNILYTISGSNTSTIGLYEAELLFEIKDMVINGDNCPEWSEFFAKSIGNHLMAHNFYTKVSRQRAIEHEKFLSTQSGGIGTFLSKMFNFNKTEIDTSWDIITVITIFKVTKI